MNCPEVDVPDFSQDGRPLSGERLSRISTELVRLHAKFYGRGPNKSKTHIVEDTVICILRGGFITIEDTLIGSGYQDSVLQLRRDFQQAMEQQFRRVVEEATGRRVIAYLSMVHVDPDLAIELFVLAPSLTAGPAAPDPDVQTDGGPPPNG